MKKNNKKKKARKNERLLYSLCENGRFEPLMVSDANNLDDFIKDVEQFFDNSPSGYRPYTLEIEENTKLKPRFDFTKILVTHKDGDREWKKSYFIWNVITLTSKDIGADLGWPEQKSKRIKEQN